MDVAEFNTKVKRHLTKSFSAQHLLLLKICFGNVIIDPRNVEPLEDYLTETDMGRLYYMVQVEFAVALEKERKGFDSTEFNVITRDDYRPYDVYLMHGTFAESTLNIAVILPKKERKQLAWYIGGSELLELDELLPNSKWKIASLSGTARVLEALSSKIDTLTRWAMQREMLQPVERNLGILEGDGHASLQHLNVSQQQAVATVASPHFESGLFCVQGPPGTGKTTLAVSMIAVAAKKGRVLVTAPSNAAVANVALKVFASGQYKLQDLVIFGSNCDPSVHFLHPRIRGDKFKKLVRALDKLDAQVTLSMLEGERSKLDMRKAILRKTFIKWIHLNDSDISIKDLSRMCPIPGSDDDRKLIKVCLRKASVTFCTLNQAGSSFLQKSFTAATLMLDEAGQTPESDFYIATNFPGVTRIIAIGDPRQLPATVISPDCAKAGFGVSWLEKVQRIHPKAVHLLDTQYRMDPEILAFPNRSFYEDRIHSGHNVVDREPRVETPFLFVDTERRGKEECVDLSYLNMYEPVVIQSLLKNDPDIVRMLNEHASARIIVITPYRAQVKLLKESLTDIGHPIEVATVDSFQGQEGEIVIVSTVRTQRIGFVDSAQRLCVALTRAKRILRVVGDRHFFLSLGPKSTLKNLCMSGNDEHHLQWMPVLKGFFQHCVGKISNHDKNIASAQRFISEESSASTQDMLSTHKKNLKNESVLPAREEQGGGPALVCDVSMVDSDKAVAEALCNETEKAVVQKRKKKRKSNKVKGQPSREEQVVPASVSTASIVLPDTAAAKISEIGGDAVSKKTRKKKSKSKKGKGLSLDNGQVVQAIVSDASVAVLMKAVPNASPNVSENGNTAGKKKKKKSKSKKGKSHSLNNEQVVPASISNVLDGVSVDVNEALGNGNGGAVSTKQLEKSNGKKGKKKWYYS